MLNVFSSPEGILIGIALVVFVVVRQFMARKVTPLALLFGPVLITFISLTNLSALADANIPLLGANAALEIVLGLLRGATFKLWRTPTGDVISQASAATIGLWLLLIVLRVGMVFGERELGLLSDANSAALTLSLAFTLAAQNALIYVRAQNLELATA